MTETARLAQLLASRLQAVWEAAAEITGIQPLAGGASRESWSVQVRIAGSSTTAGKTPEPTGTAAGCPAATGRRCSRRPDGEPTRPATTVTRSRKNTAAGTGPTSAWR